jgi:hypothetical protein
VRWRRRPPEVDEQRVADLEDRVAELTDVVAELLLPLERRDDQRVDQVLARYRGRHGR